MLQTQGLNFHLYGEHSSLLSLLSAEAAELHAIAKGLSAIAPTKALWKLAESDLIAIGNTSLSVGSNVKITKWVPQNDVLGHPNVKIFFTQGGTNSFNEVCPQSMYMCSTLQLYHL